MGNKKIVVFILVVALLLLSACERYDSQGHPKGFFQSHTRMSNVNS
jgi:outer membrane biogenesis lipoprotein LolB